MQLQRESGPSVFASLLALFDGTAGTLISIVLAPILIFLALWLPPLSLGERLFDAGYVPVPRAGGSFIDPDGTELVIPAEAMVGRRSVKVQFASAPRQAFIEGSAGGVLADAPAALSERLLLIKSPVYVASVKGESPDHSLWSIPIPNESEPYSLLDLYAWNGSSWNWLPHRLRVELNQEKIETRAPGVPVGIAVMQAQRVPVQVGALAGENPNFVAQASGTLATLSPRLYVLQGDGSIGQAFTLSPIFQQSGAKVIPVLQNVEPSGVVRSDLIDNLLIDPNAWRVHVERIESTVLGSNHEGVVIDYRGIDPLLRDEFTAFITTLGERMAANGRELVVRVDEPVRIAVDEFDTGAYDWLAIGQAATQVRVPVPHAAGFFAGSDNLDALLAYATGTINRHKVLLELPAAPYTIREGEAVPVPYGELVSALTESTPGMEGGIESALPLPALAEMGRIAAEPATDNYRVLLGDREIYIENAATLAQRLAQVSGYNLAGIVLAHADQADPQVWEAVATYRDGVLP